MSGAIILLLVFAGFIGVGIVAPLLVPVDDAPRIAAFSVVHLMVTGAAWLAVLYFNLVPLDRVAEPLGVVDVQAWFRPFALVPPTTGAITFAISAATRLSRAQKGH